MFGNGPKAADVNQGMVADCYTLNPDYLTGKAAGSSAFQRVKGKLRPGDAKSSTFTPDMHVGMDFAEGVDRTVMHKVSGPCNSPVGRYAPIDYSKRVSWDDATTDVVADLKRFRESTNADILRDLADITDVSYRQFHDARGHFVHGVYFKTCYGMRMPVVVLAGFNPAPPKPKARDKRRRWHDDD